MQGLTASIIKDCLRSPKVYGYEAIKQRAIESAATQRTIDDLLTKNNPRKAQSANPFTNNQNRGPQPTFWGQNRGRFNHPYSSSNALEWMANQPVPMNVGQACAPTWRHRGGQQFWGQGQGQGRVNAIGTNPRQGNNAYFLGGEVGHFAHNCL